jgi:hypothetical protein
MVFLEIHYGISKIRKYRIGLRKRKTFAVKEIPKPVFVTGFGINW